MALGENEFDTPDLEAFMSFSDLEVQTGMAGMGTWKQNKGLSVHMLSGIA